MSSFVKGTIQTVMQKRRVVFFAREDSITVKEMEEIMAMMKNEVGDRKKK
ncbi:MAG: hypothetical protein U5L72_19320 [Bacteroidales bacterium]|nr:hypothetical protein [Bacteroidales bacterium]